MLWKSTPANQPDFRYDSIAIEPLERQFLLNSSTILEALSQMTRTERNSLRSELLSDELIRTSAMEGEVLDRANVLSSFCHQFDSKSVIAAKTQREWVITRMMIDAHTSYASPLTKESLCLWQEMILAGPSTVKKVGSTMHKPSSLQTVTSRGNRVMGSSEPPPLAVGQGELDAFVRWFNETAPEGPESLPALTRAALAHLWFNSIPPCAIGRSQLTGTLIRKSLAQNMGQPGLIALADIIEQDREGYRDRLATCNVRLDVTEWILWFGEAALKAQTKTLERIGFSIAKAKFSVVVANLWTGG